MSEALGPQIDFPPEAVASESGPKRERVRTPVAVNRKSARLVDAPRQVRPRFALEKHEHYVEELWVSRRLFETHDFGAAIIDPCAGFGNIVNSALAMGLRAWGSDLVARAPFIAGGRDFLSPRWRAPAAFGRFAIVGNPPFGGRVSLIRRFAETALARAEQVALLLPVARLNAAGEWLADLPLVEIAYVTPRSSLWPGRLYAERLAKGLPLKNGFADVCWLIFDKRPGAKPGPPTWLRRAP